MTCANLKAHVTGERMQRARGGSLPRKVTTVDGTEWSLPDLQRSPLNVHGVGMTTLYRRWAKGLRGRDLLEVPDAH